MNSVREALEAKMAGESAITDLLGAAAEDFENAIYHRKAPTGAQPPFIIFFRASGMPYRFFKGKPIQNDVWAVKGISRDDHDAAEDLADQIDAALDNQSLNVDGRGTLAVLRASDIDYGEDRDGEDWSHAGAYYRVETDPDA